MRRFRWLSAGIIPQVYDLRACGWLLQSPGEGAPASCPALLDDRSIAADIHGAQARATTVLLDVSSSRERAQWLSRGFGDVLGAGATLAEIHQRALRLLAALETVPRRRCHGRLELDLLLRDAVVAGRRLALHPREFALLWRLAQSPGQPVSPQDLLAEVWQLSFRPETNSLAVHVCRLRAKLAAAGLAGIVNTTPEGCYALTPIETPAIPLAAGRSLADHILRDPGLLPEAKEPTNAPRNPTLRFRE